jgi:triacylglycerol lipase
LKSSNFAVGAIAGFGALVLAAFAARTRGHERIDPELRSLSTRFRHPSINRLLLPFFRRGFPDTLPVEGVGMTEHMVVGRDGAAVKIVVYRPNDVEPGGPALLYTHGGGLVMGSVPSYHAVMSGYAKRLGIVVASVDYRLAPEFPFPTPLDDVQAGYLWLIDQADFLGIDASRIVVGGDSAGGGLTAALCQRLRGEAAPFPIFQLLIYPMLDDRTTLRHAQEDRGQLIWTEGSNLFGWSSYLGRKPRAADAPRYAVPARCDDLAGLPPAWIGVGALDLFFEEDVDYAHRLKAAGVPCTLDIVEGAFHGFEILFPDTAIVKAFEEKKIAAVRQVIKGNAK